MTVIFTGMQVAQIPKWQMYWPTTDMESSSDSNVYSEPARERRGEPNTFLKKI